MLIGVIISICLVFGIIFLFFISYCIDHADDIGINKELKKKSGDFPHIPRRRKK